MLGLIDKYNRFSRAACKVLRVCKQVILGVKFYQTCGKLPFEGDTSALENVCRSTTMLVFVLAGE